MKAGAILFAGLRQQRADNGAAEQNATDRSCRPERGSDIDAVGHRFQFVTLAFERPQTVFRLSQWRWPVLGPYNGFSGAARIRGWQLLRFYQTNGWLTYEDVCSVTGVAGDTQLHNEDYARPWDALPVSKRVHRLVHTRHRFRRAWEEFLANEALPDTWVTTLSCAADPATAGNDCSAGQLLALAPHPVWVVVPKDEFESR
jgi:hypothetical protein